MSYRTRPTCSSIFSVGFSAIPSIRRCVCRSSRLNAIWTLSSMILSFGASVCWLGFSLSFLTTSWSFWFVSSSFEQRSSTSSMRASCTSTSPLSSLIPFSRVGIWPFRARIRTSFVFLIWVFSSFISVFISGTPLVFTRSCCNVARMSRSSSRTGASPLGCLPRSAFPMVDNEGNQNGGVGGVPIHLFTLTLCPFGRMCVLSNYQDVISVSLYFNR